MVNEGEEKMTIAQTIQHAEAKSITCYWSNAIKVYIFRNGSVLRIAREVFDSYIKGTL